MSYLSGLSAALWLLGLFAAAPALRTGARYDFVDRLRDALILGIGIPFTLGFVHAFYPIACWCALAICVAVAYARGSAVARRGATITPYVLVGALVAVTWPQLMRPVLDGDSLSYHLPNAASWVQSHSLWIAATRYWWYPPASELFAAGIYAVGGPFAVTWSGAGALALLGFRVAAWAREVYGAPPLLADALAAATVTSYPLAIQGGTLQNDVWLAAFFVESLWMVRASTRGTGALRTLAVTALIKPQGLIFAIVALATGRAGGRLWLATAGAYALWLLRDAILWRSAIVAPESVAYANIWHTTILANGAAALAMLLRVTLAESPFALAALAAALLAPAIGQRGRYVRWAACAAVVIFALLPFGYATSVAQLATGTSLRFAAPAMAAGSLVLAPLARRMAAYATPLLLASTVYGVAYVLAIFWNDGGTHVAVACAAIAVALAAAPRRLTVAWVRVAAFGVAVVITTHLAARHPLDYYTDALRVGGNSPGVYRWIATSHPAAVGAWGLRLGVVNVISPATATVDLPDLQPCAAARRRAVLLVAVAQSDLPPDVNSRRLATARACGPVLYADPIALVAQPKI